MVLSYNINYINKTRSFLKNMNISKFKINNIEEKKCECPFYLQPLESEKSQCLFKSMMNRNVFMNMSEDPVLITEEEWQEDCQGNYSNCTIIPIYYDSIDDEKEIANNTHNIINDKEILSFDPFVEDDKELKKKFTSI